MDTPEILEMILAGTDMRTLLTSAQRVCRNWASLIRNSRSIQKTLFFIPIKDSEWGIGQKIPNPLLTETFASFFPTKNRPDSYQFDFSDLVMTRDASTLAQFIRADASWRKMLVQQPPISKIGLFHISHEIGGDSAESASILADKIMQGSGYDGFRMERLVELLLFSCRVEFSPFIDARVYWSTEEPISFERSFQGINDAFYRALDKFGLVVHTCEVIQCTGDMIRPLSAEELTRREIIRAYTECGVDVDLKKRNLEDSIGEGIDLKGLSRRYGQR
ncbi:unnamed protein product [Penicillium nalgiovense]|uniref:F-box domain-containing protein n=1 Tax=Penicillium nalgiovense TaxID=60175 RepID=A0A9W4IQ12_PENNA|nr:unnamed protein product [Penicillium nalgiovense]CAG7979810.1 unnamed protein product [Penicillium nalgiovense]CAG7986175.1 unnamed protein product [Penicillium nalgiovense]CAG7991072.1 unnamed protein product [Penicillium nalgiovense]CAG7991745.1 unnamed protein product [Penicillium nalgiovense]